MKTQTVGKGNYVSPTALIVTTELDDVIRTSLLGTDFEDGDIGGADIFGE